MLGVRARARHCHLLTWLNFGTIYTKDQPNVKFTTNMHIGLVRSPAKLSYTIVLQILHAKLFCWFVLEKIPPMYVCV